MTSESDIVERDERTEYYENISYRWGYTFITFALLFVTAYRGFFLGQASWELLALVIISGAIVTGIQVSHRIVGSRLIVLGLLAMSVAAAIAILVLLMRRG